MWQKSGQRVGQATASQHTYQGTSDLTMKQLSNIHPGEVLLDEFLRPMRISQNALARAAVRLAKALGTSEQFWMGLQTDYDLEKAHHVLEDAADEIRRIAA